MPKKRFFPWLRKKREEIAPLSVTFSLPESLLTPNPEAGAAASSEADIATVKPAQRSQSMATLPTTPPHSLYRKMARWKSTPHRDITVDYKETHIIFEKNWTTEIFDMDIDLLKSLLEIELGNYLDKNIEKYRELPYEQSRLIGMLYNAIKQETSLKLHIHQAVLSPANDKEYQFVRQNAFFKQYLSLIEPLLTSKNAYDGELWVIYSIGPVSLEDKYIFCATVPPLSSSFIKNMVSIRPLAAIEPEEKPPTRQLSWIEKLFQRSQ